MKLSISVELDSGGTITINGEDLTAEGVNEVFAILGGYSIEGAAVPQTETEEALMKNQSITDSMKEGFVEGFEEGRPSE